MAAKTSVEQLYGEFWADENPLDAELEHSLEPRGTDWLFEVFAALGPQRGQLVVDVGARDAVHTIRLVRDHGLRAIAVDPVHHHVELARRAIADAGHAGIVSPDKSRAASCCLLRSNLRLSST